MLFIDKALTLFYGSLPKKIIYVSALLILVAIFSFCIFYYTSSYDHLRQWYFSLNSSFYKSETWAQDFFTPAVKLKGNELAQYGAITALLLIIALIISWRYGNKKDAPQARPAIDIEGRQWYFAVIILALSLGIWSWSLVAPACDEMFSAVNCAELHPFQTISYYMLPNNHMYFNFINNILFRWLGHTVQSGRFISLTAYTGVLVLVYHWLYRLINNRFYAFIALLPVAFQFTAWGMAGQARGYELLLLCSWASFTTMLRYAATGSNRMLRINTVFNILGFAVVSTYLFFYLAQTIILLCVMVHNRSFQWRHYKHQFYIFAMVFLLYLPALCFSGIQAFTANPYVTPTRATWFEFLPNFMNSFKLFINYCFSMLCGEDRAINFVLFFLPLILFFSHRKERRLIGFCYVMVWAGYILVTLNVKRPPYTRNMIAQHSLTMAFVVFAFYVLMERAATWLPGIKARKAFLAALFVLPVIAFVCFLGVTDKQNINVDLYEYNVNQTNKDENEATESINTAATIGCTNESYNFYYYLRAAGPNVHHFTNWNEEYIIMHVEEHFPAGQEDKYVKFHTGPGKYEFFKRK